MLDALKMPADSKLVVAEIDLELLFQVLDMRAEKSEKEDKKGEKEETTYETLQDQIMFKDLSFVLPKTAAYGDIQQAVRSVEGVMDAELFDLYVGENLGTDKKSMSLRLKIRGDGTMTPDQVNALLASCVHAAEQAGAEIRK